VVSGVCGNAQVQSHLDSQTAVIILTAHEEDEQVFKGIKAGAQGYLLKDAEPEDLSRAIRTVHAGDTGPRPEDAKYLPERQALGTLAVDTPLTERELEVIRALAGGQSDRQIATSLGISEKTVRNHTSNIYRKLHIFDRIQVVIYAVREGVIDVEELEYRPSEGP
jgi:DNA-binding NarL/FixJ family response regulator